MSGNTFGKSFSVTTFGESHGVALGCIIDGCPPGLEISEGYIQAYLDQRKPGTSKYTTQRKEDDKIEILSGIFEGKTTGTPIGLLIRNKDQKSKDYDNLKDVFRPSHADYTYTQKYGFRDHRGGGRSSARETAMRVAAGSIALKYLKEKGIFVKGFLSEIGTLKVNSINLEEIENNPFFCPDKNLVKDIEQLINSLRDEGDSIGAKITVNASGMPTGLGEPGFDKLDADLAKAIMSINAVKSVTIGNVDNILDLKGSELRDEITQEGFKSNNAGGILGGITNGDLIELEFIIKPTSSIKSKAQTINVAGEEVDVEVTGRHDPCVGIRAVPIAEAMVNLVLMDHFLRNQAQCGTIDQLVPFKK